MNLYNATVMLVLLAIVGCGDKSVGKFEMPEVNDDNCTTKSVEALPSDIQQEFSARCLRRSSYKESDDREW